MEKDKDAVAAQKRRARTPEGKERLFYMVGLLCHYYRVYDQDSITKEISKSRISKM